VDISVVARLQNTLADLLAGDEALTGVSEPTILETLSPTAIDRFRRHLQVKRLKLVSVAQPASVMAATVGRSFTEVAAQFWRSRPPRTLRFTDAATDAVDSWTSFARGFGPDIGAPWLADLARYERERYRALLRADLLGRPSEAAGAFPVAADDHFVLADHASLGSFDFDVVRLHRHFSPAVSPSPASSSMSGPRRTYLAFVCSNPRSGVHVGTMSADTARLLARLLRGASVTQAVGELAHGAGTGMFARGAQIVEQLSSAGVLRRRPAEPPPE